MKHALILSLSLVTLGLAMPVAASESGTHSCTADVGAAVMGNGLSLTTDVVNIGGCQLVVITDSHTVDALDPAEGCQIQADIDGNGQADETAELGKTYGAGTSFTAFCEVGTLAATNSITLS